MTAHPISLKPPLRETIDSYLGMIIALGALTMFFGSLFVAYMVLRLRQTVWPPPELPPFPQVLPFLNTIMLVMSSITFHLGVRKLEMAKNGTFKLFLGLTILLGLSFFALQYLLWQRIASAGLEIGTSLGSIFYGMTVLHGAHLLAGLLALFWLVPGALRGTYLDRGTLQVRLVGLFWHFLGVIWIILYLAIFVV